MIRRSKRTSIFQRNRGRYGLFPNLIYYSLLDILWQLYHSIRSTATPCPTDALNQKPTLEPYRSFIDESVLILTMYAVVFLMLYVPLSIRIPVRVPTDPWLWATWFYQTVTRYVPTEHLIFDWKTRQFAIPDTGAVHSDVITNWIDPDNGIT